MMNRWGNDDHGPGGDPSWLGGSDRPDGENRSGDWSSDFGGPQREQAPEYSGPRFGDRAGEEPASEDQAQESPWRSSFDGLADSGGRSGALNGKSFAARMAGWSTSVIGLVIFIVIASRFGMSMWWVFLVFGVPMIPRLFRLVSRYFQP